MIVEQRGLQPLFILKTALLITLLLSGYSEADDFNRKTTWATDDVISASKLNADPDETARILGTSGNGLIADGNVKATADIQEMKILFDATSGHDHDGIGSKLTSIPDATDTTKGIATFNTDNFLVTSGDVTIKDAGVNLATEVTGTLPEANGGTGVTSGVMIEGDPAGGDLAGTYPNPTIEVSLSNVIFSWSSVNAYSANTYGMVRDTTQQTVVDSVDPRYEYFATDSATYATFLNFRFLKTSGVDTITIETRIYTNGNFTATLNVDIGGASNTVAITNQGSPDWRTATDINVSGLSDGTTYDGIVQLKTSSAGDEAYCDAVTLIASG